MHFFIPVTTTAIFFFFFLRQLIFCSPRFFLPEILRERGEILGNRWEFIRQSIPKETRPNPDISVLFWCWENLGLAGRKGHPKTISPKCRGVFWTGKPFHSENWRMYGKNHQQSTKQKIKFQTGWKSGILCAWRLAAFSFWGRIFAGAMKIKVQF